jgi:hypothetical protein
MHRAIYFYYQAGSVAIEVYNEAVNDLLAAEVEPLEAVAAQRRPESPLSRRHSMT